MSDDRIETPSILDTATGATLLLVLILISVAALWYVIPILIHPEIIELAQRGQIGDSYGSVNALFTGLAFAGLIFTILLQHRELKLQRLELNAQLVEMQLARKESERQSKLQERQIRLETAQILIKPLEVEIEKIKIKADQWTGSQRYQSTKDDFESVIKQMRAIIAALPNEKRKSDA